MYGDKDSADDAPGSTSQGSLGFYTSLASENPKRPHISISRETQGASLDALDNGSAEVLADVNINLVTVAACLDTTPYETISGYGTKDATWTCDGAWTRPPVTPVCRQTYLTLAGDTCEKVATKFSLKPVDIYYANSYVNCYDLWVGTPMCKTIYQAFIKSN